MITIVNYGVGNLGSMQNMLRKIGVQSRIASSAAELRDSTKIILPGVGSFDAAMTKLMESEMVPQLNEKVLVERVPTLGVCLGMQMMTAGSEEGVAAGLGWIDAKTIRFDQVRDPGLKVPHMGWNEVVSAKESPLIADLATDARFYFAHSYFVDCAHSQDVLLKGLYGNHDFVAAFQRGNLMGAQFHPEKSHRFGMWFLKNFVERC